MAGPLSPFFKSPFTDLTGVTVSHQWFGPCQKFEERALDCMEAYGLHRGVKECQALMNDYKECSLRTKQKARYEEMQLERERQIKSGEKTEKELLVPPPKIDTF